jgi:hypothetical protein
MIIWKNKKMQCQNIWTKHLENGMTTLDMTLDLITDMQGFYSTFPNFEAILSK